jgi:hypothetical protein
MQKHIELMEGDSLIVYAVSREPPPPITPEPVEDLRVLLQISGVNIYTNEDGSYVCFKSNLIKHKPPTTTVGNTSTRIPTCIW